MPGMKAVLLVLAALGPGGPAGARDNPFPQPKAWFMAQATIMDRDYGAVASCKGMQEEYDSQGWPKGVSLESLQGIDKRLKSTVFLRPDPGPDTWTPLASVVLAGARKPGADCDDVAVTGAQLAVCAGFPAENLGLLVTQLPTRAGELHVVAFYNDPGNGVWVFADTMGRVRPIAKLNQTLHYYAFLDDVTHWWALRDPLTGTVLTDEMPTSSLPEETTASVDAPVGPAATTCLHKHVPDAGQLLNDAEAPWSDRKAAPVR